MNRHNNDTPYSAAEILQYLSGKMDREQTHLLERALLDDDFLAEAIEGYRMMRETMSDEAILSSIGAPVIKTNEKKQAAVFSIKPIVKWIGYAAAASMVLGGGWWILNTSQPDQAIIPVPSYQQDSITKTTEATGENDAVNTPDLVKAETRLSTQNEMSTPEKPAPNSQQDVAKKSERATKPALISPSLQTEAESYNDLVKAKNEKSGGQTQRTTRALVAPQAMQSMDSTSSDMAGETVSAKNAMTKKIPFEIVPVDTLNAHPVEGWATFTDNIKRDLATNSLPPGTATITINPNGSIGEIVLQGKFSATETQQIENWFRQGSRWKNKTNTTTRAIISWR